MQQLVKEFGTKPMFCLSIGVKGSGKTYNTLGLIEHAMKNKLFDFYIICCPTYDYEATKSYNGIKKFAAANKNMIDIYNRYSFLITQNILNNATKIGQLKKNICLFIDDAMLSSQSIFDKDFYSMLSIARHLGITILINYHSLTSGKTLSPFVRSQCDYLMLYKIVSDGLLKLIHDEYVSLSQERDWKQFLNKYIEHTNSEQFRSMLLNCRTGEIDWNLKELRGLLS